MFGENLVQLTVMVPLRVAEWVRAEGGAEFSRGVLVGAYEGLHGAKPRPVSGSWAVAPFERVLNPTPLAGERSFSPPWRQE